MGTTNDPSTVRATITAHLPNRLYRLQTEHGTIIIAGLSNEAKRISSRFEVGQVVNVRPAAFDPGRGSIEGPA